ncbi:MAG: T9SS type A sorting domain-containing protein [Muribaculaceae bacterium]|nr:T9SS type A sorting domain-containing protein [Muribaculaceae bacterium]
MKKIITLCMCMALFAGNLCAQTTIYAYRTWQVSNPTNVQKGPVKLSTDNPGAVELIADQTKLGNVYAGTYFNYKWYAQVTVPGTQTSLEGLYTIDLTDGTRTLIAKNGSHLVEMTYDYSTSTMYGIKSGAEYLMTIDLTTGQTTQKGLFREGTNYLYMLALACDTDGTLYGIASDNNLYTIDKSNGACTLVGNTGADAAFTQSMDFDRNNHVLYWINCGDYCLYTVDTTTGAATLVGPVGENGDDSVSSMFIPFINVAAGAPDRVLDRRAAIDGNNVVLSWTNPGITAQGTALTSFAGVKIYRNDELIATVNLNLDNAGKQSQYTDANVPEGVYEYKFVPFNTFGDGGTDSDNITMFVGENMPGAVGNFTVTPGDNTAELSWEKPTAGMYGGEFSPESITGYVVRRFNGSSYTTLQVNDPDALSYSDRPANFGKYTYSIYAVNHVGNGAETTAEPVLVKPASWILMVTGEEIIEKDKTYKFYDIGGPNGNYPNSQKDVLTLRPQTASGLVRAEFKSFSVEEGYDYLYIYNGANTNAPLIGTFSSYMVPPALVSVESTSPDGCLTFVFESDIMSPDMGWEAEVTMVEKKEKDLVAVSLTGNTYPAQSSEAEYTFTIINKGVSTVEGNNYSVRLYVNGDVADECAGTAIEPMQTVGFNLTFTPAETGTLTLSAEIVYADDEDVENNKSNTLEVNVLEEGSAFVTIEREDVSNVAVVPVSFMASESMSEIIYYKEEIGIALGNLNMVVYQPSSVGTDYPNVPVKMWIGETDRDNLEAGSIKASDLTLVYEGNNPLLTGMDEWIFQLQTPYEYKGGNLVILLYKNGPDFTSYDVSFKGTYAYSENDPRRTRFESNFGADGGLNPDSEGIGYSSDKQWPFVKLMFSKVNSGNDSVTDIRTDSDVYVYPNPVKDILYIQGDIQSAEIFNYSGQLTHKSDAVTSIDVSALPHGIYYVRLTAADGTVSVTKLIKK